MRHLYTPDGVSLEAQRNYGHQLVKENREEEVVVHAHGTNGQCDDQCTKTVVDLRGSGSGPESNTDATE